MEWQDMGSMAGCRGRGRNAPYARLTEALTSKPGSIPALSTTPPEVQSDE